MKAVILAGGYGTRISEESGVRPKPMVEIGGTPILWHIMKIYSAHGINDFVICCGYKGDMIKEFFAGYSLNTSRRTVRSARAHDGDASATTATSRGRVTLIDTGESTMTGGRLKRVAGVHRRRDLLLHLRRLRRRHRHRRADRVSSRTGRAGDADRDAAAGPVRRARPRRGRDEDHALQGEARRATAAGSTAASSCSSRR